MLYDTVALKQIENRWLQNPSGLVRKTTNEHPNTSTLNWSKTTVFWSFQAVSVCFVNIGFHMHKVYIYYLELLHLNLKHTIR